MAVCRRPGHLVSLLAAVTPDGRRATQQSVRPPGLPRFVGSVSHPIQKTGTHRHVRDVRAPELVRSGVLCIWQQMRVDLISGCRSRSLSVSLLGDPRQTHQSLSPLGVEAQDLRGPALTSLPILYGFGLSGGQMDLHDCGKFTLRRHRSASPDYTRPFRVESSRLAPSRLCVGLMHPTYGP